MNFQISDAVRYIPGFLGYHAATIIDIEKGTGKYIVELTSGKQITAWEDELELESL